jgi:hypothetical protein
MLKRRRFIGRNERSNLQTQTSALNLHSNCTTSILHGTTMMSQKTRSKNSSSLSRKHRRTCHCTPAGPSAFLILAETRPPRLLALVAHLVEQLMAQLVTPLQLVVPLEQLEDSGYEAVPDVFQRDGDTWELINKVHIEIFSTSLTSH